MSRQDARPAKFFDRNAKKTWRHKETLGVLRNLAVRKTEIATIY
jgi:hypothetical protein